MEFKEKLKDLRTKKEKSQSELAKDIFVSRSTVAKWENGLGLPSDDNLKTLCEYFNVDGDYFKEKDEKDWENYKLLLAKRKKRNIIIAVSSLIVGLILCINIINFCLLPKTGKVFRQNGYSYVVIEDKGIYGDGKVELVNTTGDEIFIPDTITVFARMVPDTFKVVSVFTSAVDGKIVHLPRYFEGFMDSRPLFDDELEFYPKSAVGIFGIGLYNMELENIYVSKDNELYDSREDCGCLIDSKTDTIIKSSRNSFIPSGIREIGYDGLRRYFFGKETKYIIPDCIEKIDNMAFGSLPFGDGDYIDEDGNNWHIEYIDFGSVKELGYHLMVQSRIEDNATIILPKTLEKIDRTALITSGNPSVVNIYYKGTKSDWNNVDINNDVTDSLHIYDSQYKRKDKYDISDLYISKNTQINFYYYLDVEPAEKNAYWHYNSNNEIEIWK